MQAKIFSPPVFFMMLFLVSCFSMQDISSRNMSSVYRESEKNFHPEFVTYNQTDSTVKLFIRVLPSEFLFERQPDQKFRALINIHAEVIGSYELYKIIDSASADFSFELSEKSDFRILSFDVPLKSSGTFLIHCFINDKVKGTDEEYFVSLDRISNPSRQDFLVTDLNNNPIFRDYLSTTDSIKIIFRNDSINDFWCQYYYRDFPLAPPPFGFDVHDEFDYKPDSVYRIHTSDSSGLNFSRRGFYHIQTDTSVKSGLTLFRFYDGFPYITSPLQMIEALRFLLTKKEFEEMKASPTPKSMVDNFWLTHGGNEEKTRALIKKYYGRIRDANRFFTSYTEGWRTDRGMIYTIFGSPGTIYRSSESESWIYGTPNSSLALNFFFVKVNNPVTDNDFTLTRSPTYESNWYRAVEIWRQGRAYNSFY